MPDSLKDIVVAKLETVPDTDRYSNFKKQMPGIINFIKNGKYNAEAWQRFLDKTKVHDEYRNQDYAKYFSEYAKLIGI